MENGKNGHLSNGHPSQNQQISTYQAYILNEESTNEPTIFSSTKQIKEKSIEILKDWCGREQTPPKLLNFKEILSWKIPEHLLSTAARESQQRL